jgi:hypothetical protein
MATQSLRICEPHAIPDSLLKQQLRLRPVPEASTGEHTYRLIPWTLVKSGLARLTSAVETMPIHAHLGDPIPVGLTEDGAASVHPLAGTLPAVDALELGGEPRPHAEDLAGVEGDLGLIERYFQPKAAHSGGSPERLGERSFEEDRFRGKHCHERIDVATGPGEAESVDQGAAECVYVEWGRNLIGHV